MLIEANQDGASPQVGEALASHYGAEPNSEESVNDEELRETEEESTTQEDTEETEEVLDESQDDESEESDEEETPQFETLSELAEAAGFEKTEDFLNNFNVTAKVRGEELEVSLAEAVQGYQRNEDYTRSKMELSEQRKGFETQRTQVAQQYKQQLDYSQAMIGHLEKQFLGDYQAHVNNEALRKDDPAEWGARTAEFQDKQRQLEGLKAGVLNGQRQQEQQSQAEKAQKHQEKYLSESKILFEKLPEWSSDDVREKDQKAIHEYLTSYGFTPQDIHAISFLTQDGYDHRMMMILRDAVKAKEIPDKKEVAKKKLKPAKKFIKPGTQHSKQEQTAKQKRDRQGRFEKDGNVRALLSDHFSRK